MVLNLIFKEVKDTDVNFVFFFHERDDRRMGIELLNGMDAGVWLEKIIDETFNPTNIEG